MNINNLNSIKTCANTINDLIISKNSKFLYLKKDKNNREIFIYKLNNVICTGISLCYPNLLLYSIENTKLYLPIKEKTMSLNIQTFYEKNNMVYDNVEINQTIVINNHLFFLNYNTDNYYHFIYDCLPNLYSFIHLKKYLENLKLLMYYPDQKSTFCSFVYEFLDLLNISKNDIVIIDPKYIYSSVYISTSYTHDFDSNLPPRKEIYELYEIITQKALKENINIDLPENIYISRRTFLHNDFSNIGTNYTSRRLMINETNLVEKLVENGYTEIFTEKLSTVQKIHLFNNAKTIIGSIGGGIANIIFSKFECKLIAIVSPTFLDVNERFKYCLNSRISDNNNKNTIYFLNCQHKDESSFFKKYMRVKIKNSNYIGEITQILDKYLIVNCTNSTNTGWNSENNYKIMTVSFDNVVKLDNGLNSEYFIDIEKLLINL